MDAKISAAVTTLTRENMPELHKALKALLKLPAEQRKPSPELVKLVGESIALLQSMNQWLGVSKAPAVESMADPEDEAMLAMVADEPVGDMTDDEASRLLAEMDKPAEAPVSNDMNDDEAMRLLAEMDAPASAPAPVAKPAAAAKANMDDDEAMRLLAEMDAPASAPVPAPAAKVAAPAEDEDDADALLRQLEADCEPAATAASTPAAKPAASAKTAVSAKPAPPTVPVATHQHGAHDLGEEIGEINEWEANDFQSDPDMMNDFINNTGELMETLDGSILRLEQEPENKEVIEEIFRAAHTLKGAAGMFGFRGLERVMHRTENLFDLVRKGKMVPNSDVIDVVFQAMDVMKTLLGAVKNGTPSGAKTAPIVTALTLVAAGKKANTSGASSRAESSEPASAPAEHSGASAAPSGDSGRGGGDPAGAKKKQQPEEVSTIRVDLKRLDALVNLVGELVIDRTRFVHVEEELRQNHAQLSLTGNMTETLQLFGRHMNEVQDIIMKVRMVPIGNAFNKYPRVVRDLARKLGKKIELNIEGAEAELDKTLVEQIGDPLIHLIRNSCDHGVESPEDRVKNGKDATGTITLSAHQEGNHIVITIADDGKGIPVNIIRKKAIEKGLIKEDDVLSEKDIFNLIFEPGFSTAEKVTEVSGRGVGMDVVKRQIQKLKGMIDIDSKIGKGTTTSIQLPLTLAIVQSLLIEAGGEVFAIPLSSVVESIRIQPQDIQRVGDTEIIKIRDQVMPLIHLREVLDLSAKENSLPQKLQNKKRGAHGEAAQTRKRARRHERLFVVVVGSAERRYGIVVDQLLNQQEMVIKSMGPLMKHIPCVAGGAVLGHGEVVLVLDVAELIHQGRARGRTSAHRAA
jgi:two-component system chemotaxis sensor kinase CheA